MGAFAKDVFHLIGSRFKASSAFEGFAKVSHRGLIQRSP
jgi:hypothetical protein